MGLREIDERVLEIQHSLLHRANRFSQVHALVEGDLVVPTASRVDLRAERPCDFCEPNLDVRVDVLQIIPPWEAAGLNVPMDSAQAFRKGSGLLRGQDSDIGEHPDVRDAPRHIVSSELSVDGQRCEEAPGYRPHVRRRGFA